MSGPLRRLVSGARQTLLTVGAVLGVTCILLTVASAIFGLRPLVFESGSMAPAIDTGALAIARDVAASSLEVGDIVSVPTGSGERVTHRIVTVTVRGDTATLALRGDANEAPDARTYQVSHADRVLFAIPFLGYVVGWLTGPAGLFLLGLYAAFLLPIALRRGTEAPGCPPLPTPPPKPARGGGHRLMRTGLCVLLVLGASGALGTPLRVTPTLAAWSDPAGVSGTNLAAYTVPAPAPYTCTPFTAGTNTDRGVVIRWPRTLTPGSSYTVTVDRPTLSIVLIDVGADRQATVRYQATTYPNLRFTVSITASPSGTPAWASPVATWKFDSRANNVQPVCGEITPPTATIAAPDTTTRTAAAERTFVTSTCTTNAIIICGTMTDASTIASVEYILQRVQGTTQCWDGNAWAGNCTTYRPAQLAVYAGQTVWLEAADQMIAYPATGGAYSLTVRVTDEWANVTTLPVQNFTVT